MIQPEKAFSSDSFRRERVVSAHHSMICSNLLLLMSRLYVKNMITKSSTGRASTLDVLLDQRRDDLQVVFGEEASMFHKSKTRNLKAYSLGVPKIVLDSYLQVIHCGRKLAFGDLGPLG